MAARLPLGTDSSGSDLICSKMRELSTLSHRLSCLINCPASGQPTQRARYYCVACCNSVNFAVLCMLTLRSPLPTHTPTVLLAQPLLVSRLAATAGNQPVEARELLVYWAPHGPSPASPCLSLTAGRPTCCSCCGWRDLGRLPQVHQRGDQGSPAEECHGPGPARQRSGVWPRPHPHQECHRVHWQHGRLQGLPGAALPASRKEAQLPASDEGWASLIAPELKPAACYRLPACPVLL